MAEQSKTPEVPENSTTSEVPPTKPAPRTRKASSSSDSTAEKKPATPRKRAAASTAAKPGIESASDSTVKSTAKRAPRKATVKPSAAAKPAAQKPPQPKVEEAVTPLVLDAPEASKGPAVQELSSQEAVTETIKAAESKSSVNGEREEASRIVGEHFDTLSEPVDETDSVKEPAIEADTGEKKNEAPARVQTPEILAPGYWRAAAGPAGVVNVFAYLGFLTAVLFAPLGLFFSLIGLKNTKAVKSDSVGKLLSYAGAILSGGIILFYLFHFVFLASLSLLNSYGGGLW